MRDARSRPGRIAVAALAVAGTYAYFLIFPQFAFLHALRAAGLPANEVRALMGVMALGGIAASLAVGRFGGARLNRRFMVVGAVLAAVAAALFASAPNAGHLVNAPVALLSGAGLGLLTVALAASLRGLCGAPATALACGLGTGAAYALANLPALFNAAPADQATAAAALVSLVPIALLFAEPAKQEPEMTPALSPAGFRWGVTLFLFLIWLDSACFAIIQETDVMRRATWGRDADLVCNGLVHALVAVATGVFYRSRHLAAWASGALALLVIAALMLGTPDPYPSRAHTLYAAGVSIYSTLLVAWLPLANGPRCGARVAALYALAGWIGSALGVGMALDLHRIPGGFLAVATAVFVAARATGAMRRIGGEEPRA